MGIYDLNITQAFIFNVLATVAGVCLYFILSEAIVFLCVFVKKKIKGAARKQTRVIKNPPCKGSIPIEQVRDIVRKTISDREGKKYVRVSINATEEPKQCNPDLGDFDYAYQFCDKLLLTLHFKQADDQLISTSEKFFKIHKLKKLNNTSVGAYSIEIKDFAIYFVQRLIRANKITLELSDTGDYPSAHCIFRRECELKSLEQKNFADKDTFVDVELNLQETPRKDSVNFIENKKELNTAELNVILEALFIVEDLNSVELQKHQTDFFPETFSPDDVFEKFREVREAVQQVLINDR